MILRAVLFAIRDDAVCPLARDQIRTSVAIGLGGHDVPAKVDDTARLRDSAAAPEDDLTALRPVDPGPLIAVSGGAGLIAGDTEVLAPVNATGAEEFAKRRLSGGRSEIGVGPGVERAITGVLGGRHQRYEQEQKPMSHD